MKAITWIAAAFPFLFALTSAGSIAAAQARFEVLTRDSIDQVSGLRVVTIRDNQLAACYTVFIMESAGPGEVVTSAATPEAIAEQDSVLRIREAAERYDRQVAELNAEFEARVGRPPIQTGTTSSGGPIRSRQSSSTSWTVRSSRTNTPRLCSKRFLAAHRLRLLLPE